MSKHQPALLGGLFIGLVSATPLIGALNACCCLWVILGGGLTVFLQQQRTAEPVETADAVLGGLLAGLIGAVIFVVGQALVAAVFSNLGFGTGMEELRSVFEGNPDVPVEFVNFIERLATGQGVLLLMFVITLPIYAVFSMLGSLLGLAIFRKKTPPQSTVEG